MPHVIRLSARAQAGFFEHRHDLLGDEANDRDLLDELRRKVWGELEGYAGRICPVRRGADAGRRRPNVHPPAVPDATADVVAPWALIDYFKVMARRIRSHLRGRDAQEGMRLGLNSIGDQVRRRRG